MPAVHHASSSRCGSSSALASAIPFPSPGLPPPTHPRPPALREAGPGARVRLQRPRGRRSHLLSDHRVPIGTGSDGDPCCALVGTSGGLRACSRSWNGSCWRATSHDRPGAGRPGPAASPRPPAGARARAKPGRSGQAGPRTLRPDRAKGISLGAVVAPANRHDSVLLPSTLDQLAPGGCPSRPPCTSIVATTPQGRGRAGCPWVAGPDRQAGSTGPDPGRPALAGGTHPRLGATTSASWLAVRSG
jgi:hypothetical protein